MGLWWESLEGLRGKTSGWADRHLPEKQYCFCLPPLLLAGECICCAAVTAAILHCSLKVCSSTGTPQTFNAKLGLLKCPAMRTGQVLSFSTVQAVTVELLSGHDASQRHKPPLGYILILLVLFLWWTPTNTVCMMYREKPNNTKRLKGGLERWLGS